MEGTYVNKKTLLLATLISSAPVLASAETLSNQDIQLIKGAATALNAYRAGGVHGMRAAIDRCYASLSTPSEAQVNECAAIQLAAMQVNSITAKANGFERDRQFTDGAVANELNRFLTHYGMTSGIAGTRTYIAERADPLRQYVNMALKNQLTVDNVRALHDEPPRPVWRELSAGS